MSRLQRFLAVLYPAALVCLVEAIAVVAWGGVERAYLPRLAGLAVLAVLAGAALAGGALAQIRLQSPRAWLSVAWAVAAALCTALVLANGAPPRYGAGTAGWAAALFLGGVAGLLAGLARFVLPRPVDRGHALLLEPILFVAATAGLYVLLTRLGVRTGAVRTILPWAGVLFLAIALSALSSARGRPDDVTRLVGAGAGWRERLARADGSTRAALSIVLWIGALAAAAAALGRSPFEPMRPPRASGPPDVLLVVLDTVRADAIASKTPAEFFLPSSVAVVPVLGEEGTQNLLRNSVFGAPHLAAFARDSLRFVNAFSTSCWTLPAHASLFTGMEAAQHRVGWADAHLPTEFPSLPALMQKTGRRTVGFSANPWIAPEFGFDRGFEHFVAADLEKRPWIPWVFALLPRLARAVDGTLLWEDKDGLVLASEAVRALSRARRPAFVFVNLMEAHLPYAPPLRVLEKGLGETEIDAAALLQLEQDPLMDLARGFQWKESHLAGLRALYAAEITYLDGLLGRMLDRLRQSGRLQRTLVVLVSDHGENLGEHRPLDHQLGLWDTLVHVPLIVHLPGGRRQGEIDERMVSLADLPEAIAAWSSGGPSSLDGPPARDAVYFDYDLPQPILDRLRDRPSIDIKFWAQALMGIRTTRAKWVLGSGGYEFASELRDGREWGNWFSIDGVLGAEPPFPELRDRLLSWQASFPRRPAPPSTPLSSEAAERLRSLGYVK